MFQMVRTRRAASAQSWGLLRRVGRMHVPTPRASVVPLVQSMVDLCRASAHASGHDSRRNRAGRAWPHAGAGQPLRAIRAGEDRVRHQPLHQRDQAALPGARCAAALRGSGLSALWSRSIIFSCSSTAADVGAARCWTLAWRAASTWRARARAPTPSPILPTSAGCACARRQGTRPCELPSARSDGPAVRGCRCSVIPGRVRRPPLCRVYPPAAPLAVRRGRDALTRAALLAHAPMQVGLCTALPGARPCRAAGAALQALRRQVRRHLPGRPAQPGGVAGAHPGAAGRAARAGRAGAQQVQGHAGPREGAEDDRGGAQDDGQPQGGLNTRGEPALRRVLSHLCGNDVCILLRLCSDVLISAGERRMRHAARDMIHLFMELCVCTVGSLHVQQAQVAVLVLKLVCLPDWP